MEKMSAAGDAELRRRVLALVRASRPGARARESRLQLSLARFASSCRALAACASCKRDAEAERQAEQALWAALEELNALAMQGEGAGRLELPRWVAQRMELEPTLEAAKRFREEDEQWRSQSGRKRARTETTKTAGVLGSAGVIWSDQAPTREVLALADLIMICVLHCWAIVRLDALLEVIDNQKARLENTISRVVAEESVSLPVALGKLACIKSSAHGDWLHSDSHGLARWAVGQFARIAFPQKAIEQQEGHQVDRQTTHSALVILEALCAPSALTFQHAITAITSERQQRFQATKDKKPDGLADLKEQITPEFLAFVSGILFSFLDNSLPATHVKPMARDRVLESFQLALEPSSVIQVLRRLLTRDLQSNARDIEVPSDLVTPISLQGPLFYFISRCASASVDFSNRALTLAHELAEDAVQSGKTWFLGLSLELVAIVASSPLASSSCYNDWFHRHFGKEPSKTLSTDNIHCQKRPTKANDSVCRLIHSKNHLQLVCLFLVEFDRRKQSDDTVMWTASHVMTHLSVLKSFQGQNSPENDLVIDFCAQERVCCAKLQSKGRAGNLDNRTTSDKTSNVFSSEALNVVKENITYYREHLHLSPQLKQWKTFQYQKWKTEILPCCLSISLNDNESVEDLEDPLSGSNVSVVDHIRFVFALAKANMVPAEDYFRFTCSIQDWIDLTRESISKDMQSARQRTFVSSLNHSIRSLRNICKRANAAKIENSDRIILETVKSISEALFAYIDSRAGSYQHGNQADEESRQAQLTHVWQYGFIEVLDALGPEYLETFYRYQISLLTKLHQTQSSWPILSEMIDLALSFQPKDGHCVKWMASFAGVAAVMCSRINRSQTSILGKAVSNFSFISADCVWPKQDPVLRGYTLFMTLLLAFHVIDEDVDDHDTALMAWSPAVCNFGAWCIYFCCADVSDQVEHHMHVSGLNRGRYAPWLLSLQRSLRRTTWLKWSQERLKRLENVENVLDFEFKYRWILTDAFNEISASEKVTRQRPTMTARLNQALKIIDEAIPYRRPLEWCQVLLDMLFGVAVQHNDDEQNILSSVEIESSLELILLLLNTLISRVDAMAELALSEVSLQHIWLLLTIDKLTLGRNRRYVKSRVYRASEEASRILFRHRTMTCIRLPLFEGTDKNPLLDLLRLVSGDLQAHTVTFVGRGFIQQLYGLLKEQHLEGFRGISVIDLPIPLLVEWGLEEPEARTIPFEVQFAGGATNNAKLLNLVGWTGKMSRAMLIARPSSETRQGQSAPDVSQVFDSSQDALKYLIKATEYILSTKNLIKQPVSSVVEASVLRRIVELVLDAGTSTEFDAPSFSLCPPQSIHNDSANPTIIEMIPWLAEQWTEVTTGNHKVSTPMPQTHDAITKHAYYQRFIQLAVAILCARSALASNKLLDLLDSNTEKYGVFAVFVISTACEAGQLDAIISHSGSRWVSSFLQVALDTVEPRLVSLHAALRGLAMESVLAGAASFRARVKYLAVQILEHGAERRIALQSSPLKGRLIAQWPDLEALVEQLSVLGRDDL